MDPGTRALLERSLDSSVVGATHLAGGFSGARCWAAELIDGRSVFVKVADGDEAMASNRNEAAVLAEVGSPHLPEFVGIFDGGRVLVTEDLHAADWNPNLESLTDFWAAIGDLGSRPGPQSLWQSFRGAGRDAWAGVVSDERFSTAIGIERVWMDRHGSILGDASKLADTSGDRLVHGDLAPGNWCRDVNRTWRFVDWARRRRLADAVSRNRGCHECLAIHES